VGPVSGGFTVDWKALDLRGRIRDGSEPHLRLHGLTGSDEVALAWGEPPANKEGNPKRLTYLLQSQLGEHKTSQFVNILEPYEGTPFIQDVRRLEAKHSADPSSVVALEVCLGDGRRDILICCEEPTAVEIEDEIQFCGQFGLVRYETERPVVLRLARGTLLQAGDLRAESPLSEYRGVVTGYDLSHAEDQRVDLDPTLPADPVLSGRTIHFLGDIPYDTSYRIEKVVPTGISVGASSIIAGLRDSSSLHEYRYLVDVGDEYFMPSLLSVDR
jgi:hypothetical protein